MAKVAGYLPTIGEIKSSITDGTFIALANNSIVPNKANDITPTKSDLLNWLKVTIKTNDTDGNRCPYWEEIIPSVGILVVDINRASDYDLIMYINTNGVDSAVNKQPVYKGVNFLPRNVTAANAASAWALASDYITTAQLYYRFEFNIDKLFITYPNINIFTITLAGKCDVTTFSTAIYSYKGANQGTMTMGGSAGSYIPSVQNSTTINTNNFSLNVPSGRSNNFDINYLPIVGNFTITRGSSTVQYTSII